MYVFVISLCIVAAAFVVQRFANQIDEQLNACGTGIFKDGTCECTHPYVGTHCEIVDCGYGKLIDSVFAYDTITTPKGPSGCECEAQYWGYNCANCTSKFTAQCTGPCKDKYFGPRCDILCKSGTENDATGVLHRDSGGTYNYFVESHGFCLNYGDVKGTVKCREGRAGAHCELQCPLCVYGSCNLDDGTCDCFDGYFGNLCEGTCPGRCSGLNGVCQSDGTCKCYDGFTGDDCSLECCVEGRGTELSSVHGNCTQNVAGCACFEEVIPVDLPEELYSDTPFHGVGWEGSQCDCHENITCGGRGRCVEGGCECTANFQGARCDICNDSKVGPFCQYDRWQCPDRDNANGEFVAKNSRGDYGCKCNSGFTGDTCEECIAAAYPKTGDDKCTIIVPDTLCHDGNVNPDYDGTVDMCVCDTNFDTQTDCASCHDHWYGPDCDHYCRESTVADALDCGSTGGVCSNSGPGCICPKGSIFSGTKAGGGICVTCGGDEGCTNGNCIEGRCRCDPNYYGDNCNISPPKSGDKVCSGYPSVIIETAANCDLTADCLDESVNVPAVNQIVANQARIYDRVDQMFCHRDDTPKGLKNTQGCCVDRNGDGFCDKDKLESTDSCTFYNAAGNTEEGEVVNDICNKRVLEDETNVFEWCLSQERACTSNGVCEDPDLCEDRCDAELGPAEWVKIWEWEHSRTMTDVMSEPWKFASDVPDPYEYRDTYLPSFTRAHDGECTSGLDVAGYGAKTPQECADKCSGMLVDSVQAKGFVFSAIKVNNNLLGCYCEGVSSHPHTDCGGTKTWGSDWVRYDFPSNSPTIDDVCVAGEMYDVCRDYLIPDDANVFNMTHKFTDKWEPMPNYQDCTLTKVISVNVDGKVVISIDPIHVGMLETTEDNTAVFGRYQNGDAAYTGNVTHMIDSITVFGKGFTGANKLTILIYDYVSDTCSDFVRKVGSHHDMCSQIKFHELDYDWGAFCKWRPTGDSPTVYATRMSTAAPAPVVCDPASVNSMWNDATWTGCNGAQWHGGGFAHDLCAGSGVYFQPSSPYYGGSHMLTKRDYYEACCDWTGSECVEKPTVIPSFDDKCYRQSTVCTAGCDNYQEGCEGLPLLSEHPTPMPAPCDQHWGDFCTNYMDFEHKEEGVCAYTECRCEGYGIGGPACDMQCPVPAGVDTELSCGSDLNMGRCIKDRGVIAFGVEQGKCDCFNGGNPAEGCAATCEGEQDCSSEIDTPFSFEYSNCTALSNIDSSNTDADLCHVFLRDSACNFFRGRCECATPFTAFTDEEKPIYLNPHSSYRIALMQGYDIDEYLAFTTYNGTVPDRDREAFESFDRNFKCFKDIEHTMEVSCDWIRALKHFARGGSYRIGDCTNLAPGTDIEYQVPCSGHGFPQGGTCACDYAEEFETRSSGVGLSFEQPGLDETPWRGKACQFICPGYDMESMDSVCSGHGRCESDARCACDQGWTGYKCDLQCEVEQKPLTCSGHGVCDERSIILRGDIIKQLDGARCEHLPECNAANYDSGDCTNETMTLARDRVIKSGDSIYHMYYDEAIKISTYSSSLSSSVEFLAFETDFTVRNGDSFGTNPDINVCSDFTLKKNYREDVPIGGPVILRMLDSFGDGWNGFQLNVGGTTWGDTFTSGGHWTREISGLSGTIEVTRVTPGSYVGEVSFEIICKEGEASVLSGVGDDESWTFENTCPGVMADAIVIRKGSDVIATLTEIGEFSVTGAEGVYTYSKINSAIGGSLTVTDCSVVTRNAVLDDFSIEGTAVRHDYDFGSNIPFMPCQDRMDISREHAAHPLLPEMSSVDLPCNVFAQKQVVTENGADEDYFRSYQIMCGVCNCEESSQTGNWTGYDCRTPALGFFRSNARSQCPGMTADMNPCNGGGTCRWGSTDGLGIQIRDAATKCYCGDVTDEATLETAPRSEYGVLVHASSHGTPLFYDEIDEFAKVDNIVFTDTGETGVCLSSGTQKTGPRMYENSDNPGTTESELVQACGTACVNSYRTGQPVSKDAPWTGRAADDSTLLGFSVIPPSKSSAGRCYCNTQTPDNCGDIYVGHYKWYSIDIPLVCPNGTEPIKHAEDCRHGFKTDEPYSLIPSFQYCEMPDKSDQVLTIAAGQNGDVDEVVFKCYESCIDGQKTSIAGALSDPLFWSKHTKEDITHFSVATDGSSKGGCICYATNVDDCKDGDASVPLTSYPNKISYRINHHSHPYDLTTGSSNTIPALSSLTTGTCQKEFEDEVFTAKEYGPTIRYKASSSVCEEAYELGGTSVTPNKDTKVYSMRLAETDPLYDRDPTQECANRCHAEGQDYDGFMILNYVSSGNINSCLCGKVCDTPQTGYPYFKMYTMRTVPDPYEIDNTQSICHPSPLRLSNYKSDCSCKFGFTGNTCETARMMCLWNGEETDGTECICNDDGEPNLKVSKYGCCTKGTYWDQDKYASFTPLSDFEPIPANRFYQDAFLYVCKPPETLLEYENDQERILDIHNYVANTDEYLLTKPTVCGDAPEKQLFTSVFQTLTSKSPETFTVTRVTGDETRDIVVDKDKTILELKEGSEPKDQCAAFCVSKNKGYKGFSIFTPKPEMVRTSDKVKSTDAGSPNVYCENDDRVPAYASLNTDPNPGWGIGDPNGPVEACRAACTFRPRVSKTENGYTVSTPQNFWDVYSQEDITYIYIHDLYGSDAGTAQGSCSCHTGDLDTCDTVEAPTVDIAGAEWYQAHTYKLERGDTECTCEPFIANMDNQVNFTNPMSYEDNEGWDNALPRTTERYDIQFPVDIEAEAQNLGCFENIDGRVLKIDQLAGTSHSISTTEVAYVDHSTKRTSGGLTFEECFEQCKYDDVMQYHHLFDYTLRFSGVCDEYMSDYDECQDARTALGFDGIPATVKSGNWSDLPRGCLMSYTDGALFNDRADMTHKCGRYSFNCICKDPTPCDCYSAGEEPISTKEYSKVFQISSTGVGTLMNVQKNPAVNPAPCNVNSYIALGDDIVGAPCTCPIGALEEAYVETGYQPAVIGGLCNSPVSKPNLVDFTTEGDGRCSNDCNTGRECAEGLVCYQRSGVGTGVTGYSVLYPPGSHGSTHGWLCTDSRAPTHGPRSSSRYGTKITDTADPFYESDFKLECARRCRNDGVGLFDVNTAQTTCACGSVNNCPQISWAHGTVYIIQHGASGTGSVPGCQGSVTNDYDVCIPGEMARENVAEGLSLGGYDMTLEECKAQCDADIACDSFSYAEDGVPGDPTAKCRTSIDCTGFEYKFEGACDGSTTGIKGDRQVGVVPNIKACRDRCVDYRGFLYNEDYRNCVCEDNEITVGNPCGGVGSRSPSDKYTRYHHNFAHAVGGEPYVMYKKELLKATQGRYCPTGEEELYTVSITDPRADVYACVQSATLQGMEVASGRVNGLTFTCYVSDTYYANPDVTETDIIECPVSLSVGGTQYILQAGMQRRIESVAAATKYQGKAIKDELFNSELYPSDTAEGCKLHCDPYKYRHFQFSDRDKTCQCIKKEKSLLTLTGDPNDMIYQIYDFTAGLIDSPHEMCFCEGFYLLDGIAQMCPSGKYSGKLTPCSAACTNCPVGQFSDAGASECGACVAGQIQDSPTSCSKCDPGKFAKAGATTCSKCEVGRYASGTGAGECTLCPTGKYQYPAAKGSAENNCDDCPEGWGQANTEQTDCDECATGRYTVSTGTEACTLCGSGKYLDTVGSTSESQCKACQTGRYQDAGGQSSCKGCSSGKYQSSTGKTACSSCAGGKYQVSGGQTSCSSCASGKKSGSGAASCSSCSAGYYSGSGESSCKKCGTGKYQTRSGQGICTNCPVSRTDKKMDNSPYSWGTNSGYGFTFYYPNIDRSIKDSCLYVQEGSYNLQGSNSAEGFNYDKVHCEDESQTPKIRGYIVQLHVLRWCWTTESSCDDILPARMFNYDLTETGRYLPGWRQCKPYLKGYRL